MRQTPDKQLRILVVNVDEAVTAALKSAFDPVRTISLEIAPDADTLRAAVRSAIPGGNMNCERHGGMRFQR